jgi:hypothetical protein
MDISSGDMKSLSSHYSYDGIRSSDWTSYIPFGCSQWIDYLPYLTDRTSKVRFIECLFFALAVVFLIYQAAFPAPVS